MKNENENLLRIVMKCSLSVSQRDLVIKTKRDNEEIEITIMAIMFRGLEDISYSQLAIH